ncbi:MAG TPA: hypothetical protein VGF80_04135 [Galbitalea sp.]
MATRRGDHLAGGEMIVACHWRHPVADCPLSGDDVHDALRAMDGLTRTIAHEKEDFVLEIFARSRDFVARREGLVYEHGRGTRPVSSSARERN